MWPQPHRGSNPQSLQQSLKQLSELRVSCTSLGNLSVMDAHVPSSKLCFLQHNVPCLRPLCVAACLDKICCQAALLKLPWLRIMELRLL